MWWWNFMFPALMGGGYLWKRLYENRQRLRTWKSAMALCRTDEVESTGFWAWSAELEARSGALRIRIANATGSDNLAVVVIEGPEGFSGLKLSTPLLPFWRRENEVGDEEFDGTFVVEGPLQRVSAFLDGTVRGQLVKAAAACTPFEIGDGRLRAQLAEKELPHILPLLLEIARRFSEPVHVERQIVKNAREDPEPGVRIFNLLLLAREHPGDPATLAVLRDACSDASPRVRVRAAIELGDEARDVLLKVVEELEDDDACAQALGSVGHQLPFDRVSDLLSRSLGKGLIQTSHACLETLGRRRAGAVGVLAKVLAEEKGELAVAAVQALGETGAAEAEAPLLQALGNEDSDVREAAAAALGRVGSVAAVQPLEDASERFWLDLGLRRAARQAIAEIQSRLEGASPGQLSLATDPAGQISLAQAESGQLALAPHELPQEEPSPREGRESAARPV